jgi:hypothetical protein
MGFGFNLFGLPLLLLITFGLIVYAIARQSWKPLGIVILIWAATCLLLFFAILAEGYRKPIPLSKADIVGHYQIDTTFYTGKNARWQYNHYRFTISSGDSLYFQVFNNDTIIKSFQEKIKYSSGPPVLWQLENDSVYHVINHAPTLFRGRKKFYYVFYSDYYGSMFFRKIDE